MSFPMERVSFLQPPEDLLAYDYFRMKSLKCLNALQKTCRLEHIEGWKKIITDHIIVVRHESVNVVKYLQDIFEGEIIVKPCQTDINPVQEIVQESAAERFASKATLDSHLVIIFLETERNNGKIRIIKRDEEMLSALRHRYPLAEMKKFRLFAPSVDAPTDRQELKKAVKEILKLGQSDILEINSTKEAKDDIYSLVIKHGKMNIECIVESMKELLLDVQNGSMPVVNETNDEILKDFIIKEIQTAMETFSHLKRILSSEMKENEVTDELQKKFDMMKDLGYAGHVYINKMLTIFVQENTDKKTRAKLKEAAEKYFDNVKCSPLSSKETVKQFTRSLQHDERIKNHNGLSGRIGAFARQHNKMVAITVPHFVTSGQDVQKGGEVIGTCIWPPPKPDNVLMNKISVIEINADWQNVCSIMHENMNGDMRPFTLHLTRPKQYSKVYKGRQNTGFITGRVVSNEAKFPLGDNMILAYLVEGDDELPFSNDGDSGVVVKLQKELDGHLNGLSIVFGGALDYPDIELDTCVSIPLAPAVQEYEQETNRQIFFR